jgi:hypothetical protein
MMPKKSSSSKGNGLVTIGSCLSNYVAINYSRMLGDRILTNVYHNRSDMLSPLLEGKPTVLDKYTPQLQLLENRREMAELILRNQLSSSIGLHMLKKGVPLLEVLEKKQAGLILVDNYIDMTGKLAVSKASPSTKFFFNSKHAEDFDAHYQLEDQFLDVEMSMLYFSQILEHLVDSQPQSKVVFLNFPLTFYPDAIRQKQTAFDTLFRAENRKLLRASNFHYLNCPDVTPVHDKQQKQHFKPTYYNFIAGCIASPDLMM